MSPTPVAARSTGENVLLSGVWVFGGSIGIRGLQFARTIVAARLLEPTGFGRFVLAAAILGVIEAVSHPAIEMAVIQTRTVSLELLRTAWTARLLRGVVVTALVLVLAPVIASAVGEPEITGFLRALAFVSLLQALTSFSLLLKVRQADLGPMTRLQVLAEAAETVVGIAVVVVTDSPWGLVIGRLSFGVVAVASSYLIPGFVPALRLALDELMSLFRFSRWAFLSNLFMYLSTSGDDVVVGAVAGARPLGLYRVAYRLANLPLFDLVQTAGQVAFPALARLNERSPRSAEDAFRRYVVLTAGLAGPAAALLVVTAHDLILVLVGGAWTGAATALAIIAVAGFLRAVGVPAELLLMALGRPELTTAIHVARTVVLFAALALLLGPFGVTGAALATVLAASCTVPVWIYGLARVGIGVRATLAAIVGRLPAAAVCALTALALRPVADPPLLALLAQAGGGAGAWLLVVRTADRRLYRELTLLLTGALGALRGRRAPGA